MASLYDDVFHINGKYRGFFIRACFARDHSHVFPQHVSWWQCVRVIIIVCLPCVIDGIACHCLIEIIAIIIMMRF